MRYKNYINSHSKSNRIYSRDEVLDMPLRRIRDNKLELESQYRSIGVPTEEALRASSNVIWVDEYTRDDGTKVSGHWRSKPENSTADVLTGSAAGVNGQKQNNNSILPSSQIRKKEISNIQGQSIPKQTTESNLQVFAGKHLPYLKDSVHREYYKIALNLQDIRDGKQNSEWVLEHNELLQVKDIGNSGLRDFIKNKIITSERKVLRDSELNSIDVVVARPSSPLVELVAKSKEINGFINRHIDEIKLGKFKNDGSQGVEFVFPDKNNRTETYSSEFALSHTIHRTNIYDAKMIDNNTVSLVLVDYYDFASGGSRANNNAHIQQENKQLKKYMLLVPVTIKVY